MVNQTLHRRLKWACRILFVLYLVVLIYLLFFFEVRGDMAASGERHYNLEPFREIRRFWVYRHILGWKPAVENIFGNILIFIPFGALLPALVRRLRGFWKTVLTGFAFSLCVETTQLITGLGCFDIDDMILNTAGAAVGYLVFAVALCYRNFCVRNKNNRKDFRK